MKKNLKRSVLALFSLCALYANAEREAVSQEFNALGGAITYTNSDKTGSTSFVTYTCTGTNAKFAAIGPTGSKRINISLPAYGDFVTTTKVNELMGLQLTSDPTDTKPEEIKIYLSKDSVDFGEALSVSYEKGGIDAVGVFPRGNYYVRIVNEALGKAYSIRTIVYQLDHCNCFEYIPE